MTGPTDEIPAPAAPVRPGLNGGTLNSGGNEGNVYGGGRKLKAIQEAMLDGYAEGLPNLRKLAKGETPEGFRRKPTYATMLAAQSELGKVLPKRFELTGEDGGPIQHESTEIDVSVLDEDEIRSLRAIQRKLAAERKAAL